LASSRNVSKYGPVAPSAWYQTVEGVCTPAATLPPLNSGWPKYIARSATPGTLNVTVAPKARLASSGISPP
jgi:hypothetical protein